MSSKYSNIKTADELRAAIESVRREIKGEGKALSLKYHGLKDHYSPANMVNGFLKRKSDYYNWADVSLRIIRLLRKRIS